MSFAELEELGREAHDDTMKRHAREPGNFNPRIRWHAAKL